MVSKLHNKLRRFKYYDNLNEEESVEVEKFTKKRKTKLDDTLSGKKAEKGDK